jgi:hypothetical protein
MADPDGNQPLATTGEPSAARTWPNSPIQTSAEFVRQHRVVMLPTRQLALPYSFGDAEIRAPNPFPFWRSAPSCRPAAGGRPRRGRAGARVTACPRRSCEAQSLNRFGPKHHRAGTRGQVGRTAPQNYCDSEFGPLRRLAPRPYLSAVTVGTRPDRVTDADDVALATGLPVAGRSDRAAVSYVHQFVPPVIRVRHSVRLAQQPRLPSWSTLYPPT